MSRRIDWIGVLALVMLTVGGYLFVERGADYMPVWMGWLIGSLLWYGGFIVCLFWFLQRAFGQSDSSRKQAVEKGQEEMKHRASLLANEVDSSLPHGSNAGADRRVALCVLSILFLHGITAAQDPSTLFQTKCAPCHGKTADGKTPMGEKLNIRDLRSAEVQAQSDAELSQIISKGKGKMPSYESKLPPEQIRELAAYIRQLGGKK